MSNSKDSAGEAVGTFFHQQVHLFMYDLPTVPSVSAGEAALVGAVLGATVTRQQLVPALMRCYIRLRIFPHSNLILKLGLFYLQLR